MAKQQFTDAEAHVFAVAMGLRTENGFLIPNTIGHGKGLSTNREENVVKHLVDPSVRGSFPSLAPAAALIRLTDKHGAYSYRPFELYRFLKLIRSAQQLGKKGDGRIVVLWDPSELVKVMGGSVSPMVGWNYLALGIKGRVSHPFTPLIRMADLGEESTTHLTELGIINEDRIAPVRMLTTTAMVAYVMAQSTWPEETRETVFRIQECIAAQADQFTVSIEKPPVKPVVDEGVIGLFNNLFLAPPEAAPLKVAPPEAAPLKVAPPEAAPPKAASSPDGASRTAEDIRSDMDRLKAELAQVEKQDNLAAWKKRFDGFTIESGTPDSQFDLCSMITIRVSPHRLMVCAVARVIEENVLGRGGPSEASARRPAFQLPRM